MSVQLALGTPVHCSDARLGELTDVVIDPTTRRLTHLVVRPKHDPGASRLVPIELADQAADGIALRCTRDEAEAFEQLREVAFLRPGQRPPEDPEWDVGIQDVLAMPYYSATGMGDDIGLYDGNMTTSFDRVPKGEVEIRRTSLVMSSDDQALGQIDGFVVDGDHITHLVLERGHLWGRRDVTIPIGSVVEVATDTVRLGLTRDDVGALPAVRIHR
jgi:sporulation protein YlmC with PRC-barrel domain